MVGRAEVVRLIEKAVPQACPHQHGYKNPKNQIVEQPIGNLLALENAGHHHIPYHECKNEAERIVSQPEGTDVKHHGVNVPMDEVKQHGYV